MERVDLFAGVSAGSIVASALATGRYVVPVSDFEFAHHSTLSTSVVNDDRSPVYMQKMLLSLGPLFFMPRNVRQFHGYPLRQAKYSMVNLKIILEESLRGNDHYMPAPCLLVSADPVLLFPSFLHSGATLDTCPRNLLISSFLLDNHKQGTNR
jgi:hypothetical protein